MSQAYRRIRIHRFGGPECLELERFEAPKRTPGLVPVEVAYAGVNRADLLMREGNYHLRTLPLTPGCEASGRVTENAEGFRAGDRVLIFKAPSGMDSDYVEVGPECLVKIPAEISLQVAASIPLNWLTAFDCLDRLMKLQPGQTVAIFAAASGVGQAAIQIALARGARPFAVVSSEDKAKYLQSRYPIPVLASAQPEHIESWILGECREGVDGVFDLVGGPRFRLALKLARAGGIVVQAANPSLEDTLINVRDFYPKNLSIFGFQYGNLMAIGKDRFAEQLDIVLAGFTSGRFQPIERSVFSVEIAAQAHLKLQERTHIGKVLIEFLGER